MEDASLLREQGVGGSNPLAPTNSFNSFPLSSVCLCLI